MHVLMMLLVVLLLLLVIIKLAEQPKEKLEQFWSTLAASFKPKTKDWITPLKLWAQSSLNQEAKLQAWLLALPNEGLQALGEKIAEFCIDMNINTDWLFEAEAQINQTTKKIAEEIIIDYCKLCLKAVENQKKVD